MSRIAELLRSRRMPQVAVLALMSAACRCSGDMQTRLSDSRLQSLCLAAPKPPVRYVRLRRTPRAAAIRPPQASAPQFHPGLAAAARRRRCASAYPPVRWVSEEARDFVLRAAVPFAIETTATVTMRARSAAARRLLRLRMAAPRSSSAPATRHILASATKRFSRRDPAGQWYRARACCRRQQLIIPRHDRGGCGRTGARAPASKPVAAARPNRRAALSSIAAIR